MWEKGGGKKLTNKQFAIYLANLPACKVVFEACGGAHHWARLAGKYGHEALMIPAQFVKPFVKSNKNDLVDAEAICEAAQRPSMRFANVRSEEQQSLGCLLKLRDGLIAERTGCINRCHAFLLEFAIPVSKGKGFIRKVTELYSDPDTAIPRLMCIALSEAVNQYIRINHQIDAIEGELESISKSNEVVARLLTIPGVGIITACYVVAWAGDGKQFKNAREFAAWAGLVPRQFGTGGITKLLGISKRGNKGLRTYLIHGARSAIQWKTKENHSWSEWILRLIERKPKSVAVVAMANKLARIIWAVLTKEAAYNLKIA